MSNDDNPTTDPNKDNPNDIEPLSDNDIFTSTSTRKRRLSLSQPPSKSFKTVNFEECFDKNYALLQ